MPACWTGCAASLRNIAPFATLLLLVGFFSVASDSFATVGNLENILTQISVTGIIAVGLTFVILCAEIDLSVASIANATGIVVAFFTLQDASVTIANIPLPGWAAIVIALAACFALGAVNAFGMTRIGIPSFIMTLAMLQIAAGICALLVRGQIAYAVPPLIVTLGSHSLGPGAVDRHRRGAVPAGGARRADLHAVRPLCLHDRRQSRGGRIFRRQCRARSCRR